ncbi:MAG: glycosyltransferase family 2 protein [Verrucomicrobiae bacterium]|nr:glycosyltransferase family 2 protein [Verrucomicrobiae bacterium]
MASVSVVIVSYKCRAALARCLKGLPPWRTVLVDNGSNDGTTEMVSSEFPHVTIIENKLNRGFAAACNQGIAVTTEPHVLLLNPDTVVSQKALERLLAAMTDGVGACGPLIRNEDGSVQTSVRRFPTLWRMALAEFGLRGAYYVKNPGREVEQLMGSCLLFRREFAPLDERFFLYFEEVDLCLRIKQAGWRVVFVPEAEIIHIGGQSSQHDRLASLRHRYRSLFEFYRKHYPRWQLPTLKFIVQVAAFLRSQQHYRTIAREVWSL